jgi:oxalate decarboxylase/phosphoglucose isomerase-like protein (cupin superfamily)
MVDEKTGATLALLKFPVGIADEIHNHPNANQVCVGISGEAEMQDGSLAELSQKSVFVFPKGEKHGATNFTKEGIILSYWDGSPEPEVVE